MDRDRGRASSPKMVALAQLAIQKDETREDDEQGGQLFNVGGRCTLSAYVK